VEEKAMEENSLSQKKFLLSNASVKGTHLLREGDTLVGEGKTLVKVDSVPIQVIAEIYQVTQTPFGDTYYLSSDDKMCLMLLVAPKLVKRGEIYTVEGCTEHDFVGTSYYQKDLANRELRDLLKPGDKVDLTVKEYLAKPEEWKKSFGGYFMPVTFKSSKNIPFDPKDIVYLAPRAMGSRYTQASNDARNETFKSCIDRYGKMTGDYVIFGPTDHKVLANIRKLAKTLGYLPMGSTTDTLTIRISGQSWDLPSNVYPISVNFLGTGPFLVTPNTHKVILEDGTVSFW